MQQLRKRMSPGTRAEHVFQVIGKKYGLNPAEVQCVEQSAYIDGSAYIFRSLDVPGVIKALFEDSNSPVSITVVLPPDLPFNQENELFRKIVDGGASVALQKRTETFGEIVAHRREFTFMPNEQDSSTLPVSAPSAMEPNVKTLSPSYYSIKERRALRRAYSNDDESSSIVS